jgi:hypothetical protein
MRKNISRTEEKREQSRAEQHYLYKYQEFTNQRQQQSSSESQYHPLLEPIPDPPSH